MRKRELAIAVSTGLALSGCAALGGNVRGDFACSAAGGICAPSAAIDDQALAAMEASGSDEDTGARRAGRAARPGAAWPAGTARNGSPDTPGTLRIVLPAHFDRFGRWRDETIVHAERIDVFAGRGEGQPVATDSGRPANLTLTDLAMAAPRRGDQTEAATAGLTRRAIAQDVADRLKPDTAGEADAIMAEPARVDGTGRGQAGEATSRSAPAFPASTASPR